MSSKEKNEYILFFTGFTLTLFNYIITNSMLLTFAEPIKKIAYYIGSILLIFKIFYSCTDTKLLIKNFILIVFLLMVAKISGGMTLFNLFIIVMSSKNINVNKIIKYTSSIMIFTIIWHMFIYVVDDVIGIEMVENFIRNTNNGIVKRESFYFVHPNTFSAFCVWTVLMRSYLKFDKLKILDYIFIASTAFFVYYFPNSRTDGIILIIAIMIILIYKKLSKNNKKIIKFSKICCIIPYICLIFTIITTFLYGKNNIIYKLDKVFSGRIVCSRVIYEEYGFSMFGQKMDILQNPKYFEDYDVYDIYIDNTYTKLVFNNGIVVCGMFLYLYTKTMKNNSRSSILIFLTILSVYGLMETTMLIPYLSFPLYFMRDYIFKDRREVGDGTTYKNITTRND